MTILMMPYLKNNMIQLHRQQLMGFSRSSAIMTNATLLRLFKSSSLNLSLEMIRQQF